MSIKDSFRGWIQFNGYLVMSAIVAMIFLQASPYQIELFEAKASVHIDPAFAVRSATGGSQ